jgi:hypothetical protein
MAMEVPIETVIPRPDSSSLSAVSKVKATLVKQGQIEPLQVQWTGQHWTTFSQDPWGNEIIHAARELGWNTILIVEMRRYEQ